MENPATWTDTEKKIFKIITENEERSKAGWIGSSLVRQIYTEVVKPLEDRLQVPGKEQMRNPRKVLTKDGFDTFIAALVNLESSAFFIKNHADDLEMTEEDIALLEEVESRSRQIRVKTHD